MLLFGQRDWTSQHFRYSTERYNNKHSEPGEMVEIAIKAVPGSTVWSWMPLNALQETPDITAENVCLILHF
ncbi:hypothetical protein AC249_AIPGENE27039 [Exaiptasia diaphana]|nr:hypothetical protein AC249_AIPGENE27039 [Exaiptasia diaphana]